MKITCVSDLHGFYPLTSGGDLLIIAGDLTDRDTHLEYLGFYSWLHKQSYKHYIFIAGNHDNLIEKDKILIKCLSNATYLCDSGTEFEGLKIWASPWARTFPNMNQNCKAFTLHTEKDLLKKWKLIPNDTHILITHFPPLGIFDSIHCPLESEYGLVLDGRKCIGSQSLYNKVRKIKPLLHCFGHVHEGYGYKKLGNTTFVNASHVNEHYKPVNKPIDIEL